MKRYAAAVAVLSLVVSGCASDSSTSGKRGMTNMETGAIIGAAGRCRRRRCVAYKKNRTAGAIVGAVGGGLAGGAIGAYMDSQKKDLDKNLRKEIQSGSARVDKMPNERGADHHDQPDGVRYRLDRGQVRLLQHHGQGLGRRDPLWQDDVDGGWTHGQQRQPWNTIKKLSQDRALSSRALSGIEGRESRAAGHAGAGRRLARCAATTAIRGGRPTAASRSTREPVRAN